LEVAKAALPIVKSKSKRTVADELKIHLEVIKPRIKPSTHGIYQRNLERYIVPYFGEMRCERLSTAMLQGFVDKQIENGLSAVTVQSVFSLLRSGLRHLFTADFFDVRLPKKTKNEVEVLSVSEQKRLEAAARSSDDIDCLGVLICLYTGLRIGEICGLSWSSIDFERQTLHVKQAIQRIKNDDNSDNVPKTTIASLTPKSGASLRSIPLPGFLLSLLSDYRNDSEFVISRDGAFIEPRNLQYRFKNLLIAANVKDINFHCCRHTFAARALESGFDIKTLSEIMGHSSAVVTLQKYAHVLDEHKRKSMEALESVYR
jgi:integrase